MDILLNRLGSLVNGVITGFDRIVFKGIIKPIMHAAGMQDFYLPEGCKTKILKSTQ